MASSARRNSARSLPDLGLTFVRWSFVRGASWRGYWLLASLYLVVVADLSASQLVLIGAGQATTVLLAELPAGIFADTVSRRRSLIIAHLVTGAGMVMLGVVASFPALALSQALCGLGWAFASGADVAWITDELDDQRVISRVLAARARWELSGAVAGIVALGGLAWVTDLRTGIVVAGLTMLALGAVVALRFPEQHFTAADPDRRWHAGLSLLSSAVRLAKGDRVLLLLSSSWLLVNGGGEAYGRLADKRLIDLGFGAGDQPIVWFIALGLVTLTLGSSTLRILEHRLGDEDVARRSYIACCAAGVVGLALFASAPDARYAIAGVMLTTGCAHPGAVVRALTEISVNQRTTSAVRATVHSLFSLAEHIGEIALGLMLATLTGATSLTASLVGSAALLALAGGLVSRTRPRHPGARLAEMNLNHLNLRVRDAEACRDFYQQHFEFEPAFEAEGGYFIRNAAGFLLALVPTSNHAALPEGFHIGFGLESGDAVRSTHRRLSAAGVEVADVHTSDDYVTFRCWDPDGTEVEVFWEQS